MSTMHTFEDKLHTIKKLMDKQAASLKATQELANAIFFTKTKELRSQGDLSDEVKKKLICNYLSVIGGDILPNHNIPEVVRYILGDGTWMGLAKKLRALSDQSAHSYSRFFQTEGDKGGEANDSIPALAAVESGSVDSQQ